MHELSDFLVTADRAIFDQRNMRHAHVKKNLSCMHIVIPNCQSINHMVLPPKKVVPKKVPKKAFCNPVVITK